MAVTLTRRLSNESTHKTRTCTQCGERRPLTSFRRRSRSSHMRHRECNSCHAANMRFQRRIQKQRDAEVYLAERLALLRQTRTVQQRLALVDELTTRLGGPEHVAELFHQQLQRVQTEHRHGAVLRMLNQYITIITTVAQQKDDSIHNPLFETLDRTVSSINDAAEQL